ncbi:hypothetical protein D6833_08245 [Candidatus Parcubacteria bacterium]|nr:MAG: hypothetical protein D6833_08245 [Candidatus Parcubacteria bacterium]
MIRWLHKLSPAQTWFGLALVLAVVYGVLFPSGLGVCVGTLTFGVVVFTGGLMLSAGKEGL